jgi:hypothetical protein
MNDHEMEEFEIWLKLRLKLEDQQKTTSFDTTLDMSIDNSKQHSLKSLQDEISQFEHKHSNLIETFWRQVGWLYVTNFYDSANVLKAQTQIRIYHVYSEQLTARASRSGENC